MYPSKGQSFFLTSRLLERSLLDFFLHQRSALRLSGRAVMRTLIQVQPRACLCLSLKWDSELCPCLRIFVVSDKGTTSVSPWNEKIKSRRLALSALGVLVSCNLSSFLNNNEPGPEFPQAQMRVEVRSPTQRCRRPLKQGYCDIVIYDKKYIFGFCPPCPHKAPKTLGIS